MNDTSKQDKGRNFLVHYTFKNNTKMINGDGNIFLRNMYVPINIEYVKMLPKEIKKSCFENCEDDITIVVSNIVELER